MVALRAFYERHLRRCKALKETMELVEALGTAEDYGPACSDLRIFALTWVRNIRDLRASLRSEGYGESEGLKAIERVFLDYLLLAEGRLERWRGERR